MAIAIETDEAKAAAPLAGTGPGLFGIRKRNRSRMVIAVVLALLSLGPLLYMLSLSFQPNGGLLGATVLIPTHPTIQNYVQAWTENSFSHYFVNSLFVAIATVAITVVFASLAAFAFARYRFPLKELIFYIFLASLAVPNLLLLIPQFLLMDRLHLLNSLVGLVLLYVASNLPFTIFLLRGFFEAIPRVRGIIPPGRRRDAAGARQLDRATVAAGSRGGIDVHLQRILGRVPNCPYDDQLRVELHAPRWVGRLHRRAYDRMGSFLCGFGHRHSASHRGLSHLPSLVPKWGVPRCHPLRRSPRTPGITELGRTV